MDIAGILDTYSYLGIGAGLFAGIIAILVSHIRNEKKDDDYEEINRTKEEEACTDALENDYESADIPVKRRFKRISASGSEVGDSGDDRNEIPRAYESDEFCWDVETPEDADFDYKVPDTADYKYDLTDSEVKEYEWK